MKHTNVKKIEWLSWCGIIFHFLAASILFIIASWTQSEAIYVESWHIFSGIFIWFIIVLHARQRRAKIEEETDHTMPSTPDNSLFEEDEDPFSAIKRLAFFEKWIVPFATLIFGFALIINSSFFFYKYTRTTFRPPISNSALAAAFLGGIAFFSLLYSKYALGLAKEKNWTLLRAGGSYLFLNAVLCFFTCISMALYNMGILWAEYYMVFVISGFLMLIGLEMLFNLFLEIYRPRVAGKEIHFPYDSRFLELCTGSKGLLKTAAHTLDYQFGFQVSETWFYRFLEKAVVPLLIFQILVLYFINCIIVVHPQDQAIIERFGRPLEDQILQPGIHYKLPWPIEKVYHYPANRLLMMYVGIDHSEGDHADDHGQDNKAQKGHSHGHSHRHSHGHSHGHNHKDQEESEALLYTKDHGHAHGSFFMTAQSTTGSLQKDEGVPVSLLAMDFFIHYRISNILHYSYKHKKPDVLLESIASRELTKYLAGTHMQDLLGNQRLLICQQLQKTIQQNAEKYQLGIEVVACGFCNIHPPTDVALDFESVLGAMEQKETAILEATKYKNEILPLAEAEAEQILIEAEAYKENKINMTKAEVQAFQNIAKSFEQGEKIYLNQKYLKTLEKQLQDSRIYVIDVFNLEKEVDILNLEDKLSSDLLQLDFNETEQKK